MSKKRMLKNEAVIGGNDKIISVMYKNLRISIGMSGCLMFTKKIGSNDVDFFMGDNKSISISVCNFGTEEYDPDIENQAGMFRVTDAENIKALLEYREI